ncbi:MAG TPA: formylmethanofuran--tetrahydromethanopterin N-formyltransferase [Candidatus Polarisedimenticolia bacterium]|nr:formylmethanofuran--tetrahydromethanopterin N-formyltransferase [Candidatus Polarisedimenticolia bacterium]
MLIGGTFIEDTYAEAFGLRAARLLVTSDTAAWAQTAALSMTGFATSIIACGCEAGMEGPAPAATPDGRPGVNLLLFARTVADLQDQVVRRVGQCVMTAAGASCYDALGSADDSVRLGSLLRFFGDGMQTSKRIDPALAEAAGAGAVRPRRLWRIPVMDGEFVVDDRCGVRKGVAGGNFLILGRTPEATLAAAERAVAAIRLLPEVILPFPGGVVRSGSKVGSKYRKLIASTNSPYCPTLRGVVETALPPDVASVLEIVIDGLTVEAVGAAVAAGVRAACGDGIVRIGAGNYGGRLGKYLFHLRPLLSGAAPGSTTR